ncbi:hypothetical protein EYF80_043745 [Liparis tanakae]|uniref:Uncharacterized protein n=1 Tax=Liparis tanakae TaxID=230148 RepID=A0A4Z2FXM7_9TELE|nr:hypothetical protein EYF80_043745 [Liparis tanakae]
MAPTSPLQTLESSTPAKSKFGKNPPEAVENGSVWVQADHSVFDGDSVDERLLVVEEVGVGDPELVGDPVIQRQVEGDSYSVCTSLSLSLFLSGRAMISPLPAVALK